MSSQFVHLRVHSEYSLIDGLIRVKELTSSAQQMGMTAMALTDQANMFAIIKFYQSALASGVKPIIGCDLWIHNPDDPTRPFRQPVLCLNQTGYRNLIELISKAYQTQQILDRAVLSAQWFDANNDGLLMLSGGVYGDVGQALITGHTELAQQRLEFWLDRFGDRYYFELQRTGRSQEEHYIAAALDWAERYAVPVVATNDVMFMQASDYEAHEARVCINESRVLDDPRREHRYSDQQYFKSADEMTALFSDCPAALENTVEIARRCTVELALGTLYLPEYPIPESFEQSEFFQGEHALPQVQQFVESALSPTNETSADELHQQVRLGMFFYLEAYQGLAQRLSENFESANTAEFFEQKARYEQRLRFELSIILKMGFPGYFLIVMDFIRWAKTHNIPVGPGRGSGAGSLVAYVQRITDLDPLKYDLLFERFLNPERVSMPDFDVDFCMEQRDRVIQYVADRYGRDSVAQIVTFGTLAAKAVVRDVARVQGKSYGLADRLSKLIPGTPGMTLEAALTAVPELQDAVSHDEEAAEIFAMAKKLEGITRQRGKHAGGVVIAPTRLTDFSPLVCDADGQNVLTQYDKNDVETAGLIKFDFLGLRTLTIIDWALTMINDRRAQLGQSPIKITQIPQNDAKAFAMLKAAQTTAVFQVESRGMKELILKMAPDNLEEMIALVALYRPGPLDSGMVQNFINRKHGREKVSYPDANSQHESLKPILESTYGIIVYQEQVMQIAQTLAGYTLGEADLLRRAMGKKKPEEMRLQRDVFAQGAAAQGIDANLAAHIFDLVEKFAGYGFNKSHSAAYALVSYQTLWLKAHYAAAFLAATMSSDIDHTAKVVVLLDECRQLGVDVLPPDVNQGQYLFTVNEQDQIVFGLGAVKGVGAAPVQAIVTAREAGGVFVDLFDFCARIEPKKMSKRVFEALIQSGALDGLGDHRAQLMEALPDALRAAEQSNDNVAAGMTDLFGEAAVSSQEGMSRFQHVTPWSLQERLAGEQATLGLFLTGHPIDEYQKELKGLVSCRLEQVVVSDRTQILAGLVVEVRRVRTRQGNDMIFVTLDDQSARLELTLFPEPETDWMSQLKEGQMVIVLADVTWNSHREEMRVRGLQVMSIAQARAQYAQHLVIEPPLDVGASKHTAQLFVQELRRYVKPCNELSQLQRLPVQLWYRSESAEAMIRINVQFAIAMTDQNLHRLRHWLGEDQVRLTYDMPLKATH